MSTPLFTLNPAQMLQETTVQLLRQDIDDEIVVDMAKGITCRILYEGSITEFQAIIDILDDYMAEKIFKNNGITEEEGAYKFSSEDWVVRSVLGNIADKYQKLVRSKYLSNVVNYRRLLKTLDYNDLVIMVYNDFKAEGM